MEVERGRGSEISGEFPFVSRDLDGFGASVSPSPLPHSSRSPSPSGTGSIEHRVSKMDTLAGIAIKYGVEVADIKRMNGLVTDLQMFAYKKLQIPSPGRHPPSPVLSNGSACNGECTPPPVPRENVMDSFHSLKLTPPRRRMSDAMSSLQGYYGLTPTRPRVSEEGTELSVYRYSNTCEIEESAPRKIGSGLDLTPSQNHKIIRSSEDDLVGGNEMDRRPKTDVGLGAPDVMIKEESKGSSSSRKGKGLALRPKSGSRADLVSAVDIQATVRKSSSTPNLEDSESSSMWPTTRWALKTDLIARPLLDGLPKPMTFLKLKAARD